MSDEKLSLSPSLQRLAALALIAGAILGLVFDRLFVGQPLGISVPWYTLLLLLFLYGLGQTMERRPSRGIIWLIAPLLFLATMVVIRANPFLMFLNVMGVLILLAYVAAYFVAGDLADLQLSNLPFIPTRVLLRSATATPGLVAASVDVRAMTEPGRRRLLPLARGVLLALPVLVVFTGLLAAADPVFAAYVDAVFHVDYFRLLFRWSNHLFWSLLVAWLVAGGFYYALVARESDTAAGLVNRLATAVPRRLSLGIVEAATILGLVDALFLAFVAVQSVYLFGGRANIAAGGFTYSEYARRGFFELVAVAALSLALIMGLHWITRRETKGHFRRFNLSASLLVVLVMIILVSAFRRMALYEATFGLTQLRLYTYVFMLWLGALLLWSLVTLWRRPEQFAVGLFVAALGFLITLNVLNPDAFIARRNLARAAQGAGVIQEGAPADRDLDAFYLSRLSDDAVPVLVDALVRLKPDDRQVVIEALGRRRYRLESDSRWQAWSSFHLARWRAYWALTGAGIPAVAADSWR